MIYGPDGGDLNVLINNGGEQAIKSGIIYSNSTNDITIDLGSSTENDIGQEMIIYGQDCQGTVTVNAQSDCKELQLYCPINDGTRCLFNCLNNVGNDQCKESIIYTNYGIGTDLQFRVLFFFFVLKWYCVVVLTFCLKLPLFLSLLLLVFLSNYSQIT